MIMKFTGPVAALIMFLSFNAAAQTTRVGYVDIDRVTENSKKINKAMNSVKGHVEDIQKEVEEKRQRLADVRAEIKKGEGVLADSEIKKKQDEINKLEKDLVDLEYEGRREYQRLNTTLFEPMIKTIVLAIQDVAKEKNIDLVVRGEAVIYGAKSADITEDVIKKLNSPAYNLTASKSSDESDSDESSSTKSSSNDDSANKESTKDKGSDSEKSDESQSDESSINKSIIPNIPLKTRPVDRQQE